MVTVGEWSVVVISDGPIEDEANTTNADKCPNEEVFHMVLRVMIQIWDLVKVYIINDAHTKWANCECSNIIFWIRLLSWNYYIEKIEESWFSSHPVQRETVSPLILQNVNIGLRESLPSRMTLNTPKTCFTNKINKTFHRLIPSMRAPNLASILTRNKWSSWLRKTQTISWTKVTIR
jgi:hypothetical protein